MRTRLLLLVLPVLAALALAPAAMPFNPQPEPPGFQALIDDINSLSMQNPQPLLAKAEAAASSVARGEFCPATNQLNALTNFIEVKTLVEPGVSVESSQGNTRSTITPREAEMLIGDIAAVMRLNEFPPGPCLPPPDGE